MGAKKAFSGNLVAKSKSTAVTDDPRNAAGQMPAFYTLGPNGMQVPVYTDPQGNWVDVNGLPITAGQNGANGSDPVSPNAPTAAVGRSADYWADPSHKATNSQEAEEKLSYMRTHASDTGPHVTMDKAEQSLVSHDAQSPLNLGIASIDRGGAQAATNSGTGAYGDPSAYSSYGGANTGGIPLAGGAAGAGAAPNGFGYNPTAAGIAAPYQTAYGLNSGILGNLQGSQLDAQNVSNQAVLNNFQSLGTLNDLRSGLISNDTSILNQQNAAAQQANSYDWGNLANYQSALTNANNFNAGNLNNYLGEVQRTNNLSQSAYNNLASSYGNYSQLAPSASSQWQGDLTSQAAQAYADPSSIAAQNLALGQLQGAANGSLDVVSQGAQAYADPQAIQAQYSALGQLQSAANGALNTTSQAAQAYADPQAQAMQMQGINKLWDVANGANNTSLDPGLLASQNDALQKFKDLSNPEVTDQERFLYEQSRLSQEQQNKASSDAAYHQLAARGMGSSGLQLAYTQANNQTAAENRMLSDLGANANAIQRAQENLQDYATQSGNMQGQYVQNAQFNANMQTQALGLYTDAAGNLRSQTFDEAYKRGLAGDQTAIANADRMLQASGMSADEANNIRQQSFNEAYSRGVAADNVNTANSNRDLQAMGMSGDLASTQRQQSFNEAFSRGSAADQMSQYNRSTSLAASQWADTYRANQQNDAWGRDTDLYGAGMQNAGFQAQNAGNAYQAGNQYSTNYVNNATGAYTSGQQTNQGTYGRTQDTLTAQGKLGTDAYNSGVTNVGASNGAWQFASTAGQQNLANQISLGQLGIGNNNSYATGISNANAQGYGDALSQQAAATVQNQDKKNHLLQLGPIGIL